MSDHAVCDGCGLLKPVTSTGRVVLHFTKTREHQRGTERVRRVRRQCPGSGRPPRRGEP